MMGTKATLLTGPVCPLNVRVFSPVDISHSLAVWSSLPVSTKRGFAKKLTPWTGPVCPLNERTGALVMTFHRVGMVCASVST